MEFSWQEAMLLIIVCTRVEQAGKILPVSQSRLETPQKYMQES